MEQRQPRKRQRTQTVKKEVKEEVKKELKKELKRPRTATPAPRRRVVLNSDAGIQLGMTVSKESQDRRMLRRVEQRLRKLEKDEKGPKVQSVMTTTLTLGPVLGNPEDTLRRQMRYWLNPILLKPEGSGTATTPLSQRGSQYDLYKVCSVVVVFQPLVGPSIVSGSLVFADLDQEASAAKPENVDTIKARPHIEVPIGKRVTWKLPERALRGPRSGWWYVDTNEDPSQSMGPGLNFWTYMQTSNLLSLTGAGQQVYTSTTVYYGSLFLVELKVSYQFANYNPKPALSQLKNLEADARDQQHVKLVHDNDGHLLMEVDRAAAAGLLKTWISTRDAEGDKGQSGVFWSVAGTVVDATSSALGPWGWLLKAGWWVVRRIFGTPDVPSAFQGENKEYYAVYASVEDAARESPVHVPVSVQQTMQSRAVLAQNLTAKIFAVKQLNNPNLLKPLDDDVEQYSVPVPSAGGTPEPSPPPSGRDTPIPFLPLCKNSPQIYPPFLYYEYVPPAPGIKEGSYQLLGGPQQRWAIQNLFYLTGLPAVHRFHILQVDDSGQTREALEQVSFACQDPRGNFSYQFSMPDRRDWFTRRWWWLDYSKCGALVAAGDSNNLATGEGSLFNQQGVWHTCESFLNLIKSTEFFKFVPRQEEHVWRGLRALTEEVGVPLQGKHSEETFCLPVAYQGDPHRIGLLLARKNVPGEGNLMGVVYPDFDPEGGNPALLTDETKALQLGLDAPQTHAVVWTDPATYMAERLFQIGFTESVEKVPVNFVEPSTPDDFEPLPLPHTPQLLPDPPEADSDFWKDLALKLTEQLGELKIHDKPKA